MKQLNFLFVLALAGCASEPKSTETLKPVPYTAPVFSNPDAFEKVEAAFPVIKKLYADYAEKSHFPSIAYGIIINGELVFSGAIGQTNLDKKTSATTKSVYRIASMSKSFTAMAILKLRDEGKLNLTDPVKTHIPQFGKVSPLTTDAAEITIQNLMTMSAGFPEDNPWGDRQLSDSDAELLALLEGGVSFSNVPGTTFEYSNLGFALLGKIVSNVSGMPYQQYITTSILQPLGMNDSKWEYSEVPEEQLAVGYRWEDDQWKEEPMLHDGSYGAMGGMLCSIEDFAKYVALHLSAWPPRNDAEAGPVKRSSVREMHQPWRFNNLFTEAKNRMGESCPVAVGYGYGLGWRKDCKGLVRISHSGGLPGFGSEWRIYPEYGIGVVSFSNGTYGAPGPPNAVALDTLIYMAGLKPRALPAVPLLESTKEKLMVVLQDWSKANESGLFAENFFLDESLEHRQKATQKLFEEAGKIKSVLVVQPENQLRGTFVIECETKNINVFFTLTPEANPLVQQLDLWIE